LEIIFLGTGGTMPSGLRGLPSIAVRRGGELLLFDCGEGTQRAMAKARLGFGRPMRIFITHLHGDHILGLPGLIQTMNLLGRERPLHIYGPGRVGGFLETVSRFVSPPEFPLILHIVSRGVIYRGADYRVEAVEAEHEGECWSYAVVEDPRPGRFHPEKARRLGVPEGSLWKRLQRGEDVVLGDGRVVRSGDVVDPPRKGRKVVYSGDTRPNRRLVELARGADVLIHEATFDDSLRERAMKDGHSTAREAAEIASEAGVGLLVLTHISARYPDPKPLLEDAEGVFPKVVVAEDLMVLRVPLSDEPAET
jgi:ribonuclease Z